LVNKVHLIFTKININAASVSDSVSNYEDI